jgi:signal transduction histidine kinase
MKVQKKITIPLFYKVMAGFFLLIVILMAILILSSRLSIKGMKSYFVQRIEDNNTLVIKEINTLITENQWDIEEGDLHHLLEELGRKYEIEFELYDVKGLLVKNIRMNKMKPGPMDYMGPKINGFDVQRLEKEVAVLNGEQPIGLLKIFYFDANMMTPEDIRFFEFIDAVFKYVIVSILFVGLIISYFIAKSITKPLSKVCTTAHDIRLGQLNARAPIRTNTRELIELSEAINYLADTLEKEDTLRKQVTSDMAHEIRTPLSAIRNFFEAFMDGIYETTEENLGRCHQEIVRLSELVDRLNDIASIEAMTVNITKSTFDLSKEVNDIVDWFRHEFDKKDIHMTCYVPYVIMVSMDINQLKQILTNLLTNALRYTDPGGHVELSVLEELESVIIQVKDNGIGIEEKDLAFIFERFYRADKSRNRATGGLGVGLTIVQKLVKSYGGYIDVQSAINEGTTIRLIFNRSDL